MYQFVTLVSYFSSLFQALILTLLYLSEQEIIHAVNIDLPVRRHVIFALVKIMTAGMELAGVKEIRYNRSGDSCFWGVARADGCATPNGAASSMPDLHPEPIEVECSVDVDWWLKPSA